MHTIEKKFLAKIYVRALFLALVVAVNYYSAVAQSKPNSQLLEKWLHATINIETVSDNHFRVRRSDSFFRKANVIDSAAHMRLITSGKLIKPGTALFVFYHKKFYLVSARHVFLNDSTPIKNLGAREMRLVSNPCNPQKVNVRIDGPGRSKEVLVNGESNRMNFIFENQYGFSHEEDLVALNLVSGHGKYLVKRLVNLGYYPITIDDIDTSCLIKKGDPIFAIGYPSESRWQEQELTEDQLQYYSDALSLPVVSTGTVDDVKPSSSFFSANIFTYRGFSGGPIISGGRLIGITSGASLDTRIAGADCTSQYVNFESRFIKASAIMRCLRIAEKYDDEHPF